MLERGFRKNFSAFLYEKNRFFLSDLREGMRDALDELNLRAKSEDKPSLTITKKSPGEKWREDSPGRRTRLYDLEEQ
jgi:hypothetical protein